MEYYKLDINVLSENNPFLTYLKYAKYFIRLPHFSLILVNMQIK